MKKVPPRTVSVALFCRCTVVFSAFILLVDDDDDDCDAEKPSIFMTMVCAGVKRQQKVAMC